jgi:hypothetical protein
LGLNFRGVNLILSVPLGVQISVDETVVGGPMTSRRNAHPPRLQIRVVTNDIQGLNPRKFAPLQISVVESVPGGSKDGKILQE